MADPFTVDSWKSKIVDWWREAACDLPGATKRLGVRTAYGLLTASAWLPFLAAYAGNPGAAIVALSGIVGGVGTNLLSNVVQGAYDKTNAPRQAEQEIAEQPKLRPEYEQLLAALHVLATAQAALGDQWNEFEKQLREELRQLGGSLRIETGGGAVVLGSVTVQYGDFVGRDRIEYHYHVATPPGPQPPSLPQALKRYLDNLIDTYQHLRLQGIRAGGQPLSVALEKVYVSLTAMEKRTPGAGKARPQDEKGEAELTRGGFQPMTIDVALKRYRRLVIIGDPGCGKTTLLAYLALTYARDLRDRAGTVRERLKLDEGDHLPILLPLHDLGRHLKQQHSDSSQDGPALLTDYLQDYYVAQSIQLPEDFFAQALEAGRAAVLLDGMDEVAETRLRQRVARLVEKFAVRYPKSRLVVTSREVGYEGASRIGADFGLAKVREFSPDEVRQFVRDWTRVVEVTLAGRESEDILRMADEQAGRLVQAIETNPRISELAVNPLLLTVIALVHRYRAALPERRSELYEEAVEVLLARWDEAKGMEIEATLAGRQLDAGDRRSLLEPVALWLHEKKRRELELDDLRPLLLPSFKSMAGGDASAAGKALDMFARLINERSGLLVERGAGMYGFAHLTFQEYLAARAVADREDAVVFTLKRLADAWWREVILLEAGYLSTQGKRRVSELVRAIMDADPSTEPQPYHHLILAAECLYDVGAARLEGDLLGEVKQRLKKELDKPLGEVKGKRDLILRRVAAANALSQIESGQFGGVSQFWKAPWGEPDWVNIPAGEFWMGSERGGDNEKPVHKVRLKTFQIARVPVTNAQYALFVADQKIEPPKHWRSGQPPKGEENHPVVYVRWHDAQGYCRWLSGKLGKHVRLPTEAEWEKAAGGGIPPVNGGREQGGAREFPWGDEWSELKCNSYELGLQGTSPVGFFTSGASPYGCLDMVGNVWEWCQSEYAGYPYREDDGRENLEGGDPRVLRGGSWYNN